MLAKCEVCGHTQKSLAPPCEKCQSIKLQILKENK